MQGIDEYSLWAALLVLGSALAWVSTLFTLPGNWIIVLAAGVFAWFYPAAAGPGIGWISVGVLIALALVGEVLEFAAGAAGAAKRGGSRRGIALSLVGAAVGSIGGAIVSLPIPLIGPLVGAIGGGALGAFAGAYLGETWKGRSSQESVEIGKGAAIGRLVGTAGKMAVGIVMVIIVAVAAFYNP